VDPKSTLLRDFYESAIEEALWFADTRKISLCINGSKMFLNPGPVFQHLAIYSEGINWHDKDHANNQ
jgi:hypothetical protein